MQEEHSYPKPPFNTNYMQYGFALPLDIAKQVIGRNGCHFKRITQETRVSYIWYDSDQNVIEIWGPFSKMNKSQQYLTSYMHRFYSNHLEKENPLNVSMDIRQSKRMRNK